jgi:hypothetical protein
VAATLSTEPLLGLDSSATETIRRPIDERRSAARLLRARALLGLDQADEAVVIRLIADEGVVLTGGSVILSDHCGHGPIRSTGPDGDCPPARTSLPHKQPERLQILFGRDGQVGVELTWASLTTSRIAAARPSAFRAQLYPGGERARDGRWMADCEQVGSN